MKELSGLFSSESVSDGHSDKICDQISDAIVDACLLFDPYSRVAIEVSFKNHTAFICGAITSLAEPDYEKIVRRVLLDVGHTTNEWGIDLDNIQVITEISRQSANATNPLTESWQTGASDQGVMYGFACDDTTNHMPLPITLAHMLMRRHKYLRSSSSQPFIGPDAKAQVTVQYENGRPVNIDSVVLSTQHLPEIHFSHLQEWVREEIIRPVLPEELCFNTKYFINPTGNFELGGTLADAGATGRKIIVDTYGGFAHHGGGSFSGKDPSKVDRCAAYAARQLAIEVVSKGLSRACEVRLAYAIGVAKPVAISLDTPDGEIPLHQLSALFEISESNLVDLFRPYSIIQRLKLRHPIYRQTACFGHFGNTNFSWEQPIYSETAAHTYPECGNY